MERRALTRKYPGFSRVIKTEVAVSLPFLGGDEKPVKTIKVVGIWDTGATGSVITTKVVKVLGLKPIGMKVVHTAGGTQNQNEYLVNIILPSNVAIPNVKVTEAPLTPDADMLIGMDIITLGDFVISNFNGRTTMSFRTPSTDELDFVKEINASKLPRAERRRLERQKKKSKRK